MGGNWGSFTPLIRVFSLHAFIMIVEARPCRRCFFFRTDGSQKLHSDDGNVQPWWWRRVCKRIWGNCGDTNHACIVFLFQKNPSPTIPYRHSTAINVLNVQGNHELTYLVQIQFVTSTQAKLTCSQKKHVCSANLSETKICPEFMGV